MGFLRGYELNLRIAPWVTEPAILSDVIRTIIVDIQETGRYRTASSVGSASSRETMVETFLMPIEDPVILLDGDDILFFRDISTLIRYAEPIDVAAGSFKVFDADGRPVVLSTNRHPTTFQGIPTGEMFTPITAEVQNSDAESEILRHVLLEYLNTKARDVEEIEALPLRSLVHRAIGIAGYSV